MTILNAPDDTEVLVLEMGMRGFGEISPAVRRRPTRHRRGHHGRPLPHRTGRGDRRRGDRQARARARRCRRRARPCSTPTTNGWRRWRRTPEHRCSRMAGVATCGSATSTSTNWPARVSRSTRRGASHRRLGDERRAHGGQRRSRDRRRRRRSAFRWTRRSPRSATPPSRRCAWRSRRCASGATLINDAYNANPTSMRAALEALAAMQATRRIAVLGLMAELDDPVAAHAGDRVAGRRARRSS